MAELFIKIKNYDKFQHYKKRTPPWIKLHYDLLGDHQFMALSESDRFLLIAIWLLATRYHDASSTLAWHMPLDFKQIAFTLRRDDRPDIRPLIEKNFISIVDKDGNDASGMLAQCYSDASTTLDRAEQSRAEERTSSCHDKKKRARHQYSDDDLTLAHWMLEKIRGLNPNYKDPSFPAWANEIRLMRERDGRELDQIRDLFDKANADPFWGPNILSPAKLRKQWDQLETKLVHKKPTGGAATFDDYRRRRHHGARIIDQPKSEET